MAAKGRGKRGGARVIYYDFVSRSQIAMLRVYPRNAKDELTEAQKGPQRVDREWVDREWEVAMDENLFADLMESVQQMDEIHRGQRPPSREFHADELSIQAIRKATGLSQAKFARVLDVDVGTLRNWEQGRREPTGPARALLRAIRKDPKHVLAALI